MKVLKFNLSGLLAHFKTAYTNSSKLTYEIPTFTVIEGILGAILGFNKWDYHIRIERDNLLIGIELTKRLERIMLTLNQTDLITPFNFNDNYGLISERTQIPMEHTFRPEYAFYISHKNPVLYNMLRNKILSRKSVYPIYFGSAYCMAVYGEVGEFQSYDKQVEKKKTITFSVVPAQEDVSIDFDEVLKSNSGIKIISDNLPYRRDEDFTMKEYKKVVYNPEGKGLICSGKFYEIDNNSVYLFGSSRSTPK